MQRRDFLGTMGVLAGGSLMLTSSPRSSNEDLDWANDVIQTVGQPPKFRAPVVTGLALNRQESTLAIVGDDHFVQLYDLASRKFHTTLKGHTDWIREAVFTPDGQALLTVSNDRRCLVWNTEDWTTGTMLAEHPAAIINLACAPTLPWVALVGFESAIRVYDWTTLTIVRTLSGTCDDIDCVAFSPDGQLLAAAGRDGKIRVWDTRLWTKIQEWAAHRQRVRSLEFLANGQLISGSEDQFVKISDPARGAIVTELPRFSAKLYDVVVIDDQRVATAGSDNRISLWEATTGRRLGVLKGHTGTVACLACGPRLLCSGSFDTQVRIWHRGDLAGSGGNRHTQVLDGWQLK